MIGDAILGSLALLVGGFAVATQLFTAQPYIPLLMGGLVVVCGGVTLFVMRAHR